MSMSRWAMILFGAALFAGPSLAAETVVRLTSLEWPPYAAPGGLLDNGASVTVARAAFAATGHRLEVSFFPWQRTVQVGLESDTHVGYFPEYFSAELQQRCAFSDSIGSGPLGLAEPRAAPVAWTTLEDLRNITIGTVQGYVNTQAFDAAVAAGTLRIEAVPDDLTNLRKLVVGRIGLAVIDRFVMDFLLSTEPSLRPNRYSVQFNDHILEEKSLFVCFRNDDRGQEARRIFNEGLAQIDVDAIMRHYLQNDYIVPVR